MENKTLTKFLTEVEEKLRAAQMELPDNAHLSSIHFGGASAWLKQRRADMLIKDAAIESLPTYLKRLVEICRVQDEALNDMYDSACLSPTSTPSKSAFMKTIKSRQRVAEMLSAKEGE